MAETILDRLSWFGYGKQKLEPQEIPTHDQLIAFGAEETGYTIRDYESRKGIQLAEGRNELTYSVESERGKADVIYVPDEHGWYVENGSGFKWRPKNLDELKDILDEMDHQIDRYGELL